MLNKFCQEWNPSGEYLRLEQRWAKYSSKKRILILFRKICNFILIVECFLSKIICTYTVKYSHFSLKYQGHHGKSYRIFKYMYTFSPSAMISLFIFERNFFTMWKPLSKTFKYRIFTLIHFPTRLKNIYECFISIFQKIKPNIRFRFFFEEKLFEDEANNIVSLLKNVFF